MMVIGVGLVTPAAVIPFTMVSLTVFEVYQLPIMTMAYLPDRKRLFASGYWLRPAAPSCMIPSSKRDFQLVIAWTKRGRST